MVLNMLKCLLKRVFVSTVFIVLLAILASLVYFVIEIFPTVEEWQIDSYNIVRDSKLTDFKNQQTSYIYTDDGEVLLKLKDDKDITYVEFAHIPDSVKQAFVAIEDKRFYEHNGVDWLSTGKAAVLLVQNGGEVKRGGSTITQQLARNVFLSFETSYERKIREIFLALALEQKYTKNQILEYYCNNINFGNGYYGVGAASIGYFRKNAKDLTLAESAFLCAIPNNPTYYDPHTNYDNTISRQKLILREMYLQGMITCEEYNTALDEHVRVNEESDGIVDDYAASYALNKAVEVIMEENGFIFMFHWDTMSDYKDYAVLYDEAYATALQELRTGGYKVYTSLNEEMQNTVQCVLDDNLAKFGDVDEEGNYIMQGAVTAVDNETGRVIAIVGGRSGDNSVLGLNRAFQSYKQPGSTIKPLIVYTPALELGYNANSYVDDSPIENGPSNSDNSYSGKITLRKAVEKSKNVVAWRLFDWLSPTTGLQCLYSMNFSKIVPDDQVSAASLGGLTYGVTTEEMAGAYSALANKGVWTKPTCIISIVDSNGYEIYSGEKPHSVYSKVAANSMTDILLGVAKSGTAYGISLNDGVQFACKTGTTNGNTTAWFCGYTSKYSVAVYVGADKGNERVSGLWGNTYPAWIWRDTQNALGTEECVELLTKEEWEVIRSRYTPLHAPKIEQVAGQSAEASVSESVQEQPIEASATESSQEVEEQSVGAPVLESAQEVVVEETTIANQ